MAFTRDWDETVPVDHTLISQGPTKIRNVKEDVGDRLATIISGFASGETVTGILNLPFIAQSAPSTVTDQIQLYGKVVSTKTELHAKDEDGTEIQITTAGKINAAALGGVYAAANVAALATMMNLIYPVGIVITLGVSTNPATLLGVGTWTAIAGKVIVGIDSTQTEFDTLDETGGSKTHTLTIGEMPAHTHTYSITGAAGSGTSGGDVGSGGTTGSTGGGGAHNNLQPYIVKYCWQRVS